MVPMPSDRSGGRRRAGAVAWAAMLLLAGCAGTQPQPPAPRSPTPAKADPPGARAAPLEVERQWLQSWFDGTPVRITMNADGALQVSVPREFCFTAGQHTLRPALVAVLDKVAESLRRQRQVQMDLLAAPGDGAPDPALAQRRAAAVRQHLRSRGVPESRLAAASVAPAPAVQLRMVMPR